MTERVPIKLKVIRDDNYKLCTEVSKNYSENVFYLEFHISDISFELKHYGMGKTLILNYSIFSLDDQLQ